MLRANLVAPYEIHLEEVEKPTINDDQVLLKIHSVGICGSDIQMYHGLHKYMTFPVVFGHEVGASVEQVGANVKDYKVGDLVTVEPQVTCGECYPCQIGRFNVCEHLKVMGVHQDGMACEYFAIDPKYLHHCPAGMSDACMALVEPLAVGVGSVKRAGDVTGKNVVVVGAGTIGNLTAQAAKALGAANVMITDVFDPKLELARKSGLDLAVNTGNLSLKQAIIDHFGVHKADVIIDAAATRGSFMSILEAARPSSKIIVTGNYKAEMTLELPIIQRQEIEMIGHMMYVREEFQDAIAMLSDGRVNIEHVVTKEFPFAQVCDAFKYIEDNAQTVMKIVLKL